MNPSNVENTMNTRESGQRIYDVIKEEVDAIYPQFMKRVNDIDLD